MLSSPSHSVVLPTLFLGSRLSSKVQAWPSLFSRSLLGKSQFPGLNCFKGLRAQGRDTAVSSECLLSCQNHSKVCAQATCNSLGTSDSMSTVTRRILRVTLSPSEIPRLWRERNGRVGTKKRSCGLRAQGRLGY